MFEGKPFSNFLKTRWTKPIKKRNINARMKVAILTSGGLAPCLSASVGGLIQRYNDLDESIEIIAYLNGYQGLLLGQSRTISKAGRQEAFSLLNLVVVRLETVA